MSARDVEVPFHEHRSSCMPERTRDAIILGALAVAFIWTYVVLPLAFYHA
jgi:hypothetical protein